MDIEPRSALLVITRIGYSADQRAIELTDTYCRDDYYDFVAELRTDSAGYRRAASEKREDRDAGRPVEPAQQHGARPVFHAHCERETSC